MPPSPIRLLIHDQGVWLVQRRPVGERAGTELVLVGRGDRAKEIEFLALRHQVAVLRRQVHRPDLGDGDRVLLAALLMEDLLRDPGKVLDGLIGEYKRAT